MNHHNTQAETNNQPQTITPHHATLTNEPVRLKRIGLLGGMSWESTSLYYQHINRAVREERGGLNSAPILIDSVNFADIAALQVAGKWDEAAQFLSERAQSLKLAGAEVLAIATNTMHLCFEQVAQSSGIPMVHIADPVCAALKHAGIEKVAFLGTYFSMTQDFLRTRYEAAGIQWCIPDEADCQSIHRIIFSELCQGDVRCESRQIYSQIIAKMQREQGAQAVILGCTEIALLITQDDSVLPVFDSTQFHCEALVNVSLQA